MLGRYIADNRILMLLDKRDREKFDTLCPRRREIDKSGEIPATSLHAWSLDDMFVQSTTGVSWAK